MPRKTPLNKMLASRQTAADSFGFTGELLNPDRVLEKLGLDQWLAYRDVETDYQVTAVMGSRAAAIQKMEWSLDRNGASSRNFKALNLMFEGVDMNRLYDDMLVANGWGMSPIEVNYTMENGIIWFNELIGKPPRWFGFDDENNLLYRDTKSPSGIVVPDKKFLLPRNNPSYDNPYGEALLSKSYWPVQWKRYGIKWWQVFVEKYGMPWLWAKIPRGEFEAGVDKLADTLNQLVQDGILITPNDDSVEFLEAGSKGASSDLYNTLCTYMDSAISKVWLGETLTTDIGDTGSYAASKTQQGTKDERRDQDALMIMRELNKLIKWEYELNGWTGKRPKFLMIPPQDIELDRAKRDGIMSKDMGVRWKPKYITKTYGVEEEDFEIKEPEPTLNPGGNTPSPFSFADSRFKDQQTIDNAIQGISNEELQKQAEGLLKPVIKLIKESDNFSDAMEDLLTTWPNMSTVQAEEMLTQAMFVSEAIGRLSAQRE